MIRKVSQLECFAMGVARRHFIRNILECGVDRAMRQGCSAQLAVKFG
jgi:hypothetical protein